MSIITDEMVEAGARVIEGPHKEWPGHPISELRDIRWKTLTEQERGHRRIQARAVIAVVTPMIRAAALEEAISCLAGKAANDRNSNEITTIFGAISELRALKERGDE